MEPKPIKEKKSQLTTRGKWSPSLRMFFSPDFQFYNNEQSNMLLSTAYLSHVLIALKVYKNYAATTLRQFKYYGTPMNR